MSSLIPSTHYNPNPNAKIKFSSIDHLAGYDMVCLESPDLEVPPELVLLADLEGDQIKLELCPAHAVVHLDSRSTRSWRHAGTKTVGVRILRNSRAAT